MHLLTLFNMFHIPYAFIYDNMNDSCNCYVLFTSLTSSIYRLLSLHLLPVDPPFKLQWLQICRECLSRGSMLLGRRGLSLTIRC